MLWLTSGKQLSISFIDFFSSFSSNNEKSHQKTLHNHYMYVIQSIISFKGAGKKTRIGCVLRELYGAGSERLRLEHHNFTTPSKKKIEITTVASNYHIEVKIRRLFISRVGLFLKKPFSLANLFM